MVGAIGRRVSRLLEREATRIRPFRTRVSRGVGGVVVTNAAGTGYGVPTVGITFAVLAHVATERNAGCGPTACCSNCRTKVQQSVSTVLGERGVDQGTPTVIEEIFQRSRRVVGIVRTVVSRPDGAMRTRLVSSRP